MNKSYQTVTKMIAFVEKNVQICIMFWSILALWTISLYKRDMSLFLRGMRLVNIIFMEVN